MVEILTEDNLEYLLNKLELMLVGEKWDHFFSRNHLDHLNRPYQKKDLINGNVSLEIRRNLRNAGLDLHVDSTTIVKIFFGFEFTFKSEKEFYVFSGDGVDNGSYIFSKSS